MGDNLVENAKIAIVEGSIEKKRARTIIIRLLDGGFSHKRVYEQLTDVYFRLEEYLDKLKSLIEMEQIEEIDVYRFTRDIEEIVKWLRESYDLYYHMLRTHEPIDDKLNQTLFLSILNKG
jgi:hypothetical protein